jgi:3',5'-cyclic-AMP phosphodiesterase
MTTIAQISDLHLDGGRRAWDRAERVVAFLADAPGPIDVLLVTGDIADHGQADEYADARKLLDRIPFPVLVLPGNHDVRRPFAAGLLDPGPDDPDAPLDRSARAAGVEFLLCDSTIPGQAGGLIGEDGIAWLERTLAAAGSDVPALVCFHHPPVVLHTWVDRIRQRQAERLAAVLERHPRVVGVLCGHAHTAAVTTFAGRPLVVAPGVTSTIRLPAETRDDVDLDQPPGFALHVLDDERRLVTHFRVVPGAVEHVTGG